LTSRLPDGPRFLLGRLSRLAAALLFLALAWGSIWLAADLWSGYERSELLGVPWRVLRLLANLGLAACVAIALAATFGRRRR
jgi:TRAP-type C4-dicarboxylate transport system permease small subunit